MQPWRVIASSAACKNTLKKITEAEATMNDASTGSKPIPGRTIANPNTQVTEQMADAPMLCDQGDLWALR